MFLGSYDAALTQLVVSAVAALPIWLQTAIIAIARHGDKVFVLLAAIGLLVLVFHETNYRGHLARVLHQVVVATIGSVIGWFAVVLFKEIMSVPRPFESGIVPLLWKSAGHAFPSGHAAVLLMIALALHKLVSKKLGYVLIALAIIVPLLRFAIGIHSIIDIIAGWMVGYLFAVIIVAEEEK